MNIYHVTILSAISELLEIYCIEAESEKSALKIALNKYEKHKVKVLISIKKVA